MSDSQHGDRPAWWTQMARENERLRAELAAQKEAFATMKAALLENLHETERELAALKAKHAEELRAVAERQREACAAWVYNHAGNRRHRDAVRATPLVTEEK